MTLEVTVEVQGMFHHPIRIKMLKQYILTPQIMGRLKDRESKRGEYQNGKYKNPILQCMQCRKDIKIGDHLVAPRNSANSKRYHLKCAKQVNLI